MIHDELHGDSQEDLDACGVCQSCRKIDAGTHPDLNVISPEKGEIRVDEIRTIEDALSFKAYEGRKKVVIVDDADLMNQSAANAFLKTLEEPPQESLIILVASNPDRLPETIRSRCSCIRFTPLSHGACREVMTAIQDQNVKAGRKDKERPEIADAQLPAVIRLSMGRPGIVLTSDPLKDREVFITFLQNMIRGIPEIWTDRNEMEQWLDMMSVVLRDMMVLKITGDSEALFNADMTGSLSEMSKGATIESLLTCYYGINILKKKLNFNLNRSITWNYTASLLKPVIGYS
jgi:DNA polymerase-3 subunit delta'